MFKIMLFIGVVASICCLLAGFLLGYTINYNSIVSGINDALESNGLGLCEKPDYIDSDIFTLINGEIENEKRNNTIYQFTPSD